MSWRVSLVVTPAVNLTYVYLTIRKYANVDVVKVDAFVNKTGCILDEENLSQCLLINMELPHFLCTAVYKDTVTDL